MGITKAEIEAYRENGYHIIRGVLSADEASAYREHVREEVKRDAFPSKLKYPEPAKYHGQQETGWRIRAWRPSSNIQ